MARILTTDALDFNNKVAKEAKKAGVEFVLITKGRGEGDQPAVFTSLAEDGVAEFIESAFPEDNDE